MSDQVWAPSKLISQKRLHSGHIIQMKLHLKKYSHLLYFMCTVFQFFEFCMLLSQLKWCWRAERNNFWCLSVPRRTPTMVTVCMLEVSAVPANPPRKGNSTILSNALLPGYSSTFSVALLTPTLCCYFTKQFSWASIRQQYAVEDYGQMGWRSLFWLRCGISVAPRTRLD